MTFQLIRKDGELRGFAVLLGRGRIIAAVGAREAELWRICDSTACSNEALVFCRTHSKYVCGKCLAKLPPVHSCCEFISVSVARDLAQRAQKYAEVEG